MKKAFLSLILLFLNISLFASLLADPSDGDVVVYLKNGARVEGRYLDVDNRYTYREPYPLNDIYVDNNSKHMSLGVELNFRLQPKCYNVKEILGTEYHGSYSVEYSRNWKDCEE